LKFLANRALEKSLAVQLALALMEPAGASVQVIRLLCV